MASTDPRRAPRRDGVGIARRPAAPRRCCRRWPRRASGPARRPRARVPLDCPGQGHSRLVVPTQRLRPSPSGSVRRHGEQPHRREYRPARPSRPRARQDATGRAGTIGAVERSVDTTLAELDPCRCGSCHGRLDVDLDRSRSTWYVPATATMASEDMPRSTTARRTLLTSPRTATRQWVAACPPTIRWPVRRRRWDSPAAGPTWPSPTEVGDPERDVPESRASRDGVSSLRPRVTWSVSMPHPRLDCLDGTLRRAGHVAKGASPLRPFRQVGSSDDGTSPSAPGKAGARPGRSGGAAGRWPVSPSARQPGRSGGQGDLDRPRGESGRAHVAPPRRGRSAAGSGGHDQRQPLVDRWHDQVGAPACRRARQSS